MLLAVNIGNTNLRFAVFKSETKISTWTINSKPYRTEYEFFAKFSNMYEPFGIEKDDITDIIENKTFEELKPLVMKPLSEFPRPIPDKNALEISKASKVFDDI